MLKKFILTGVMMTLALVASAAEPIKAGPQKGEELPGPFDPLNVTGDNAGEKACLYCQYGADPVAMVFARKADLQTAALIKKLDEAVEKNKAADLHACVVFCSDDPKLKGQLEELAKRHELKHVILAIDSPAGPKDYNIAKDADVTVVLYLDRTVKANHAFRKGELTEKAVGKVLADVPVVLPKK